MLAVCAGGPVDADDCRATNDSDRKILIFERAIRQVQFKARIFFSLCAGRQPPVASAPSVKIPLRREHRLYQADWLMRYYSFTPDEITEDDDNLDLRLDPKSAWAIRHPEFFPVEVNEADYEMLLRVPGIGVRSAKEF